jgi:hypothetical protein
VGAIPVGLGFMTGSLLVRGNEPNLLSEGFYILFIISEEPIDVGHVAMREREFSADWSSLSVCLNTVSNVAISFILLRDQ